MQYQQCDKNIMSARGYFVSTRVFLLLLLLLLVSLLSIRYEAATHSLNRDGSDSVRGHKEVLVIAAQNPQKIWTYVGANASSV